MARPPRFAAIKTYLQEPFSEQKITAIIRDEIWKKREFNDAFYKERPTAKSNPNLADYDDYVKFSSTDGVYRKIDVLLYSFLSAQQETHYVADKVEKMDPDMAKLLIKSVAEPIHKFEMHYQDEKPLSAKDFEKLIAAIDIAIISNEQHTLHIPDHKNSGDLEEIVEHNNLDARRLSSLFGEKKDMAEDVFKEFFLYEKPKYIPEQDYNELMEALWNIRHNDPRDVEQQARQLINKAIYQAKPMTADEMSRTARALEKKSKDFKDDLMVLSADRNIVTGMARAAGYELNSNSGRRQ